VWDGARRAHGHQTRAALRLGVVAAVAAAWSPRGLLRGWADPAPLPITPSLVMGPFYPLPRPPERDADLTRLSGHKARARGQVLDVSGRVLNARGEPVAGAHVELWQANALGRYDHPSDPNPAPLDPDFQGYGEQFTDSEGRFRFVTIKPGPYPADSGLRTPHLHFDVGGHRDRRVTQLFFAGEPLNDRDRLLAQVPRNRRQALIAELRPAPPSEDPATRFVSWDVVLPRG
jgi:protocatechuate 3,4-dioxygenase beta subunit